MSKPKSSATRKHVTEDQGNMLQQKWENRCLYSQIQSNTMYNKHKILSLYPTTSSWFSDIRQEACQCQMVLTGCNTTEAQTIHAVVAAPCRT
jgi:hypothetical protein